MSGKRSQRGKPADLTDELTPDDGQDPKQFFDRRTQYDQSRQVGRKALQLCEQVKTSLHGILAVCADDVVRDLQVLAVLPAPHTGRLQIAVAVPSTADAVDRVTVLSHLHRVSGWIRSEVASAIHRRKTPELVWDVR
ncbi:ribosome-binding factor A [Limnoglobus roseus]|uniref:Ribosome-binding factor A n=1 Tax=Limnoglobus roseus TaxID=2598579 RepID=A0A5C1AFH8_9BACT|nr:ribosome-binding factor A [Limnoglobus roseus]QEL18011.1 ribosome-binding factor A [Limnoglobus roseus]